MKLGIRSVARPGSSVGVARAWLLAAVAVGGCARPSASSEPDAAVRQPSPAAGEAGGSIDAGALDGTITGTGAITKELPVGLIAELREQGADANGRLLTLAAGFIASVECSDCGAPSYLWFLAVRCADERRCEVLTDQCEGEIRRDAELFVVDLRPVEGADPAVCASYTGTFEPP